MSPPVAAYVVGVGVASAATAAEVADLVAGALRTAGIPREAVTAVATIDSRRDHPAVTALGWPVVAVPRASLPTTPARATAPAREGGPGDAGGPGAGHRPGCRPVVAEPTALRVAGPGAVLVVPRRRSPHATAAVAQVADHP